MSSNESSQLLVVCHLVQAGAILRPWLRFPGQTSYAKGTARVLVDASGAFTWQRRTGKVVYVYMETEDASLRSNRVIIRQG